jgi:NhaP-type Na+/H+ or K+/H+ antiporter
MIWAMLGAAGMGLVWGWLVVQLIPSLRPSSAAVAGMGTATAVLYFTLFVALGGQVAAIGAAAMLFAVLVHAAIVVEFGRESHEFGAVGIKEGGPG